MIEYDSISDFYKGICKLVQDTTGYKFSQYFSQDFESNDLNRKLSFYESNNHRSDEGRVHHMKSIHFNVWFSNEGYREGTIQLVSSKPNKTLSKVLHGMEIRVKGEERHQYYTWRGCLCDERVKSFVERLEAIGGWDITFDMGHIALERKWGKFRGVTYLFLKGPKPFGGDSNNPSDDLFKIGNDFFSREVKSSEGYRAMASAIREFSDSIELIERLLSTHHEKISME